VNESELVSQIDTTLPMTTETVSSSKMLQADDVSALFGLDMAEALTASPLTEKPNLLALREPPQRHRTNEQLLRLLRSSRMEARRRGRVMFRRRAQVIGRASQNHDLCARADHPLAHDSKHQTVLQNRNRFAFLIDAAIWCRILTAVHMVPGRDGGMQRGALLVTQAARARTRRTPDSTAFCRTLPQYR